MGRKGIVELHGLDGPREREFDLPDNWDELGPKEREAIWRPVKDGLMDDSVSFSVSDDEGNDV